MRRSLPLAIATAGFCGLITGKVEAQARASSDRFGDDVASPNVSGEQQSRAELDRTAGRAHAERPAALFELGAIAVGASGAIDLRLYQDVYVGGATFFKLGSEQYRFYGGRLSYRLRFDDVTLTPFVGAGHLDAGGERAELGEIRVDQPLSFYTGASAALSIGRFSFGLEGAAVPARLVFKPMNGAAAETRSPRVEVVSVAGIFGAVAF